MLANWITLSRLPLLLAIILTFYWGSPAVRLGGVGLLFVGLMLDTVDGVVARRSGQTSLLGSVLDIAMDRTYELVLWISFAVLGLVPLIIPLIVVIRTMLTDAFRSVGVKQGNAPFAQHRTQLGRFLVASSFTRIGYQTSKVLAFCGLALVQARGGVPATEDSAAAAIALHILPWIALAFCILRGLPVIIHGLKELWPEAEPAGAA